MIVPKIFFRFPLVVIFIFLQLTLLLSILQKSKHQATAAETGHICGAMLSHNNPFHLQALTIMKEDRLLVIINNWTASVPLDEVDSVKGVVPLSSSDNAQQLGRWNRIEWLRSTALGKVKGGGLQALNLFDGEDGFIGVQFQSELREELHHQLISLVNGQEVNGDQQQMLGKYGIISDGRPKDVGATRSYVLRADSFTAGSAAVAWVPDPVLDRASMQMNLPTTGHEQPPRPSFYALTRSSAEGIWVQFSASTSGPGGTPQKKSAAAVTQQQPNSSSAVTEEQLPRVEELPGVFGVIVRGTLHLAIDARQQVFIFPDPTYLFQAFQRFPGGRSSPVQALVVPFSRYFNCSAYDGPPLEDDGGYDDDNLGEKSKFSLFSGVGGVIALVVGLVLLLALVVGLYRDRVLSGRKRKSKVAPKVANQRNRASKSNNSNKKMGKRGGGAFKKGKQEPPTSTVSDDNSSSTSTTKSNSTSKQRQKQKQQQSLKKTSWKWK